MTHEETALHLTLKILEIRGRYSSRQTVEALTNPAQVWALYQAVRDARESGPTPPGAFSDCALD